MTSQRRLATICLVFSLSWTAGAAVTHTVDGTLPNGGDCPLFGTWIPSTSTCVIDDAHVEAGNWLRILSATLHIVGVLTNDGAVDVTGNLVNITNQRIENLGSISIFPTGTVSDGGTFLHVGQLDNAGTLQNSADMIEHCESLTTGNPIEGQAPSAAQSLYLGATALDWCAIDGAQSYDVVSGDLDLLIANEGDYAVATTGCLGNDVASLSLPHNGDEWFLVRANGVPGADFDTQFASQAASRNDGIAASHQACP
jgi:hypothetical protein